MSEMTANSSSPRRRRRGVRARGMDPETKSRLPGRGEGRRERFVAVRKVALHRQVPLPSPFSRFVC